MLQTFFLSGLVGQFLEKGVLSMPMYNTLYIICLAIIGLISYFLGSLNFAIIISKKQFHQDIRQYGSKNAGMTNMMRTYGKKAAGLTLLGDALKAVVACLIGYAVLGQLGAYIGGLFCFLGHVFPAYYHFRGGKGVVTAAVAILMCNPIVFLIVLILFLIIAFFTKYISLGSIMCALLYPVILSFFPSGKPYAVFAVLMAVIIVFKHWENIKRLRAGTESKFSFKKSIRTEQISDQKKEK